MPRPRNNTALARLLAVLLSGVAHLAWGNADDALIQRGKYLAAAGNCVSCHTRPGGAPFSGGVPFVTPLGTLHSSNITPDNETGIGKWTAEDFRRALREGIGAQGKRLFPAFPYPAFTQLADEDVAALYAFFRSLPPQRYVPPANGSLFSLRWTMAIWNGLFFTPGRFSPDARQSQSWNRGAYLVESLGHCGACHSPRNFLMAEIPDRAHSGGVIQEPVAVGKIRSWSAVNLTPAQAGLAAWSAADIAAYLKTGFSRRAGAFGPMNQVISNGTSRLTPEDLQAIAVYLKSLPPVENGGAPPPARTSEQGRAIYEKRCQKCHMASGRGGMFGGPPLAGSAIVQSQNPASLINIVLYGQDPPQEVRLGGWETMPAYSDVLSDAEVAAVANYVRNDWGNRAREVSRSEVANQR